MRVLDFFMHTCAARARKKGPGLYRARWCLLPETSSATRMGHACAGIRRGRVAPTRGSAPPLRQLQGVCLSLSKMLQAAANSHDTATAV